MASTMAPAAEGSEQAGESSAAARMVHGTKVYGTGSTEVRALDDVSVEFAAGRFTAIMGPSGSGKSTLLHCMAGLDRLTSGTVWFGGIDVSSLNERRLTRLRRDEIGFVFQTFNLIPTLSAAENIVLPELLAGTKPNAGWYADVIGRMGLDDRLEHRPTELSGGQQQRVAVARALVARPRIVFADEPTGNLDSRSGAEVLALLRHAVDELDQTVVMVTHDAAAAAHSDRVVFMADGKLVAELWAPTTPKILDQMKVLGA